MTRGIIVSTPSVISYITANKSKEDKETERTALDIARIGNGGFYKANAIGRLLLETLAMVR